VFSLLWVRLSARPFAENPILDNGKGNDIADPCVLEYDNKLYLYPTEDQNSYRVHILDLNGLNPASTWKTGPVVFRSERWCSMSHIPGIGQPGSLMWAPHVSYDPVSRKFYLYYSVCLNVGVAVSDSPLGPFEDKGVLANWAIDAFAMQDVDSKTGETHWYLYYAGVNLLRFFNGEERIWVQRLKPGDPSKLDDTPGYDEPQIVLRPDQDWEWKGAWFAPKGINEAPWVVKLSPGDQHIASSQAPAYYLMYSGAGANTPAYSVGYATSDSPLGPFTKYKNNPIFHPDDPMTVGVIGPGHHSVWHDKSTGKMWAFYHQQRTVETGWDRVLMVDELIVDGGVMSINVTRRRDTSYTSLEEIRGDSVRNARSYRNELSPSSQEETQGPREDLARQTRVEREVASMSVQWSGPAQIRRK